ncbi:MAG: D-alanyl-D-alanine carboxypeptidase family protein [Beijerinckiaceae bacterium]
MIALNYCRLLAVTAAAFFFAAMPARAQRFETAAPTAILMDSETGAVLFEKAADEPTPPASMAKLMTALVLFDEMAKGRVTPDTEFVVSENAWRKGGAPSGGSTMFAALNSRIKVSDLIPGLIVLSGNDAAIVLAEGIAGSEANVAGMMTARARELGLTKSIFRNATGFSDPEQVSTARELAVIANHLIKKYPNQYAVFGLREFSWNKVRQVNRNPLLDMGIGADGLKTGNIGESGFGLVGSAVQNNQRLIVVVNGLKNARDRATEARKLLDWGFRAFDNRRLFSADAVIGEAQVFGGETATVDLVAKGPVAMFVPRGTAERVTARIVYKGPLIPPVAQGQEVARLRVQRGDTQALDVPLYAAHDVPVGSITRRAVDAAKEYGLGLVRKALGTKAGS